MLRNWHKELDEMSPVAGQHSVPTVKTTVGGVLGGFDVVPWCTFYHQKRDG